MKAQIKKSPEVIITMSWHDAKALLSYALMCHANKHAESTMSSDGETAIDVVLVDVLSGIAGLDDERIEDNESRA